MKKILLASALVISLPLKWAKAEYFTVSEDFVASSADPEFLSPLEIFQDSFEHLHNDFNSFRSFSLLKFIEHKGDYGRTPERYNRARHFGTWIRDSRDSGCLNTRGKVLVRDSRNQVTYSGQGCSVSTGKWLDPYAGETFNRAYDMQIDHFVPLKNAYISGAAEWGADRRCLYANYTGNNFHLLAVYGPENQSKSDRTPEGYMPPNSAYRCQYLAQWLKVKMIWQLNLSTSEKNKILALAKENRCDLQKFAYSESELQQQRAYIEDNLDLCQYSLQPE